MDTKTNNIKEWEKDFDEKFMEPTGFMKTDYYYRDGGRVLAKVLKQFIKEVEQKAKVEGAREYKDFHIKHLKDNDTKQLRIDEENRTFKEFLKQKEEINE